MKYTTLLTHLAHHAPRIIYNMTNAVDIIRVKKETETQVTNQYMIIVT